MKWHVVCNASEDDTWQPHVADGEKLTCVRLDSGSSTDTLRADPWIELDRKGLTPSKAAIELYRAAATAYSADQRINRKRHGVAGWARDIVMYLPVFETDRWDQAHAALEEFLSFLTGDHWEVRTRPARFERPARHSRLFKAAKPISGNRVCLLSGGLDSFVGAIDALDQDPTPVYFVSHHGGGTGRHTLHVQREVVNALQKEFGEDRVRHLPFFLEPTGNLTGERESSSRSRSFLFLAFAALAASGIPTTPTIIIPENGLISLNVPLAASRLGSHSTRTTHPHTINLFRSLLTKLGIDVSLTSPYRFMTKGDMLGACNRKEFLQEHSNLTTSCAHPHAARFRGGEGSGARECGYCVPCIIRRSALEAVGWDPIEEYTFDLKSRKPSSSAEKQHVYAFRTALSRLKDMSPLPFLLSAGPLECEEHELAQYVDVYTRGMTEVETFLDASRA